MGASPSIRIHPEVVRSIEVSFVDKKTGYLFSEEEINRISNKACKDFDYQPSFYNAYKINKNGKNPYTKYSTELNQININLSHN